MKKMLLLFVFFFALLLLAGCAATQLTTAGQQVRVTHQEPESGEDCKYLGTVTGSQGGALTGGLTSNENLETGALNDLRNKAAEMGGNLVVILTQRAGQTISTTGSGEQTNVTMTGNVYSCR